MKRISLHTEHMRKCSPRNSQFNAQKAAELFIWLCLLISIVAANERLYVRTERIL